MTRCKVAISENGLDLADRDAGRVKFDLENSQLARGALLTLMSRLQRRRSSNFSSQIPEFLQRNLHGELCAVDSDTIRIRCSHGLELQSEEDDSNEA